MDIVDGKTDSGDCVTENHTNDGDCYLELGSAAPAIPSEFWAGGGSVTLLSPPPPPQKKMNGQDARTVLVWFPERMLGHGKISTEDRDWNCTAHHCRKDEWELPSNISSTSRRFR